MKKLPVPVSVGSKQPGEASVTVGDGAAGSGSQISSDQLSATDTGTGTDNFV